MTFMTFEITTYSITTHAEGAGIPFDGAKVKRTRCFKLGEDLTFHAGARTTARRRRGARYGSWRSPAVVVGPVGATRA